MVFFVKRGVPLAVTNAKTTVNITVSKQDLPSSVSILISSACWRNQAVVLDKVRFD